MKFHKLTLHEVETVDPGKCSDGAGLQFQVTKSGSKTWVLRYAILGRNWEMGLGCVKDVDLNEARKKARKYRNMALNDLDPIRGAQQIAPRGH